MSSKSSTHTGETPQDENRAAPVAQDPAAGFQRGRIVWGRPPQPVFRAGPLPRDEGLARLLAMPPHPQAARPTVKGSVATGVTGGGNIPQAARAPATPQGAGGPSGSLGGYSNVPQRPAAPAQDAKQPAPKQPTGRAGVLDGSLVPVARPAVAQSAVAQSAVTQSAVTQSAVTMTVSPELAPSIEEDMVVMSELEPVVARRDPATDTAIAARAPTKAPIKTPVTGWGRWVVAGAALVIVAGAVFWWMNRAPSAPVSVQTTPARPAPAVVVPDVPADAPVATETPSPSPVSPSPASAIPVSASAPAPRTQAAPARPATRNGAVPRAAVVPDRPADPAPVVVQLPAVAATPSPAAPVIEPGPAPTMAAPVQTNPDAPVVTRPQKLD